MAFYSPQLTLLAWLFVLPWESIATAQFDWLYREPGLERFQDYRWEQVDWRNHPRELEILTEQFVHKLCVPFELAERTRIVPGEDDKELTKERTLGSSCTLVAYDNGKIPPPDTRLPHGGIDVGSRITRDNGSTLEKLGNAAVQVIHPGGFVRGNGVLVEQKVVCQRGLFRLIVVIKYGHVAPDRKIEIDWRPAPTGTIGTLHGRDSWRSLDPELSKIMSDKGNHIHLIVEGIYDLDGEGYVAHSQQMKGHAISEQYAELLHRRAYFFNEMLLPKVTGLEP
jgi:hypothetical protein